MLPNQALTGSSDQAAEKRIECMATTVEAGQASSADETEWDAKWVSNSRSVWALQA
jgi:hypothetical protein